MTERQWHPVGGGGHLRKWTEAGQLIEGIWQGTTPGKFGDLGIVVQPDGTQVIFPLHTVLADRLKRVREGSEIRIEYLGKKENKQGTLFKAFEVLVANPEDILPEPLEPDGEGA